MQIKKPLVIITSGILIAGIALVIFWNIYFKNKELEGLGFLLTGIVLIVLSIIIFIAFAISNETRERNKTIK